MLKKIFSLASLCGVMAGSLCFSMNLQAATEIGNGGYGVKVNGHLYLQDLVEAGLQDKPVFSSHPVGKAHFQSAVDVALGGMQEIPDSVSKAVIAKLEEIEAIDPIFSYTIALALQNYSWRMVTLDWEDPQDSGGILNGSPVVLVHLALRSGKMVRLHTDHWNQLDDGNKTALIFHEMIYALLKKDPEAAKDQLSQQARSLTSYLFSQDLHRLGLTGLRRAIGQSWVYGEGRPSSLKDTVIEYEKLLTYTWVSNGAWPSQTSGAHTDDWDRWSSDKERAQAICVDLTMVEKPAEFWFVHSVLRVDFAEQAADQDGLVQEDLEVKAYTRRNYLSGSDFGSTPNCISKVSNILQVGEKEYDVIPDGSE